MIGELTQRWTWLLRLLSPRRGALFVLMLSSLPAMCTNLGLLSLMRRLFDRAIPEGDTEAVAAVGLSMFGLWLANAVVTVLVARWSAPVLRGITHNVRVALFAELCGWRWTDLAALDSGRAEARIVYETEQIEQLLQSVFLFALPALVPLLVFLAVMAWLSPTLTAIVVVVALATRLLTLPFTIMLRKATVAFRDAFERYHLVTRRVVALLPTSVAQASETTGLRQFAGAATELADAGVRLSRLGSVLGQSNAVGNAAVATTILIVGGMAVATHDSSFGTFAAFLLAANQANSATAALARVLPAGLAGDEALSRLAALRRQGSERSANGAVAHDFASSIRLERAGLDYGARAVLHEQTLVIEPGSVTAIVGPNGAGKTSLLLLILGLLTPDRGAVTFGGITRDQIDLEAFRRRVGYLPQSPFLFSGSIADNILAGRVDLTRAAVARALHAAALEPVIAAAPLGLETHLADNGHRLSGSERQRLALARALATQPDLLILDEPTNHVDDTVGRALVDRVIRQRPVGQTIVVATHDPEVIAAATTVYDVVRGERLDDDTRPISA